MPSRFFLFRFLLVFALLSFALTAKAGGFNFGSSVAVASYKGIKFDALKQKVEASFSASSFSLISTKNDEENLVVYRFLHPTRTWNLKPLVVSVRIDGALDKKLACAVCFLRLATVEDSLQYMGVWWMSDLEVRRDLDAAYSMIQDKTLAYVENPRLRYSPLAPFGSIKTSQSNTYEGVALKDLIASIVQSFEEAGFTLLEDKAPAGPLMPGELKFVYPYAAGQRIGASYSIRLYRQLESNGNCAPCEAIEWFSPYQTLPAPGLNGVVDRATLPTRFEAGLTKAQDNMRAATERFLKAGTTYFRPAKTAPLGSPRPPIQPPVVT